MTGETVHFLDAIAGDRPVLVTVGEARKVMECWSKVRLRRIGLCSSYSLMSDGKPVSIPDRGRGHAPDRCHRTRMFPSSAAKAASPALAFDARKCPAAGLGSLETKGDQGFGKADRGGSDGVRERSGGMPRKAGRR
jgi:hypothetical protein